MIYITFLNGNEYRFINEKRAKIFAEINKTVIFRKTRYFEQKSGKITEVYKNDFIKFWDIYKKSMQRQ